MTNKTKYAMFAMVTAVVFSLGITPALQTAHASSGEVVGIRTAGSGQTNFFADSDSCGGGDTLYLESGSYVNAATDAVFVDYAAADCGGTIDIYVYQVAGGSDTLLASKLNKTATNGSHLFGIAGIDQGETIKVVVQHD